MNTAAKTKQYSCDICDHGEFEEIRVHKTPIGDLRVVKCLNCGHFYQKDRASIEYIKELYESDYFTNAYEDFNEGVKGSYLEDREQIMTFVRRRFNEIENFEIPGKRFLDIGCAYGFYLEYAKERGFECEGIELSPEAYDFCKKSGFKVESRSVELIDYPDSSFDLIGMWLCLEHFLDPNLVLSKVHSWLSDDGLISIKIPVVDGITFRMNPEIWWDQHPPDHTCDYSRRHLRILLENNGFDIVFQKSEGIHSKRWARAFKINEETNQITNETEKRLQKLSEELFLGDSLVVIARKK